jgi:FtsP/CotA-like multicopper oxidase with cupredoxin domain
MHGHDFYILAQGDSPYDPANPPTLATKNPPRRDVAMLPYSGYLVIAFKTDNPGAWLLHCHIGWHVSMGFALTFIEQRNAIKPTANIKQQCADWKKYADAHNITQDDSGV